MDKQRRKLLGLTGTALATGLAGCGGDSDGSVESGNGGPEGSNEDVDGESFQDQDAVIEFLEQEGIQTIPIVTEETSKNTASIELEVGDADGLENILLQYNDSHREEPFTIYDKSSGDFEEGVGDEMVPISEEFPQTILAPDTGEFYVGVTDVNGNTTTRSEPIDPEGTGSHRIDRKRKQDQDSEIQDIGNYSTDRNWDNQVTNTQEIKELQQKWTNEAAYTPVIEQVMTGEDLSPGNKIFPNWDGEDDGFFDQDTVKNEDDFETLLRWYLPLIKHHDRQNYGVGPSSRFANFAATMETLLNEHHPQAQAQTTGVNSLPGHGIFGVQDIKNEEFYLIDTTSPSAGADTAVGRIGDFITSEGKSRDNLWDPYHDFKPGPVRGHTYEVKSETAMSGLMLFAQNENLENVYEDLFMTDEWMDDAYQILRNGGSINPIVEPIEEIISQASKKESEGKNGIYGTLDDTRTLNDETGEIYEAVMYEANQTPGIEEIENMLGAS